MTPLVYVMMYGWPLLTMHLFSKTSPARAAVYSVVGGVLFLPVISLPFPLIPVYNKDAAIALSVLIGLAVSRFDGGHARLSRYDIPMIIWCVISPMATSLSNGLGVQDGVASTLNALLEWGIIYWVGRRVFGSARSLRILSLALIVGGLAYVPLSLYEIRMSPQLSNTLYGFFPHVFAQHVRYGGYRPAVFMDHGLMLALWMAVSSTVTLWHWRVHSIRYVVGVPIHWVALALVVVAVLAKSAGAWFFLVLGAATAIYYKRTSSVRLFQLLIAAILSYLVARMANFVSVDQIIGWADRFFDLERVSSLAIRLQQEDLFGARAMQRPILGWGWMDRAWPVDYVTGVRLVPMVDSLFVIVRGSRGLVGLISVFTAMLIGPWLVFSGYARKSSAMRESIQREGPDPIVLSLVVVFFMIDSLFNAMANPIYILTAGALVSYYRSFESPIQSEQ